MESATRANTPWDEKVYLPIHEWLNFLLPLMIGNTTSVLDGCLVISNHIPFAKIQKIIQFKQHIDKLNG